MKSFLLTGVGLLIATVLLVSATFFELDWFESVLAFLTRFEAYELDEFIFPILIVLFTLTIDLVRKYRKDKIELEKAKIYRAMLSSSHHILNNFLNQMQLFKITAEGCADFDKEVLSAYDGIMNEAQKQIEALRKVNKIDADEIRGSVNP